jgi:hypothetical protein
MKKKWIIAISALLAGMLFAEEARQVGWEDLTVNVEFEDFFNALTDDQRMELSIENLLMESILNQTGRILLTGEWFEFENNPGGKDE